MMKHIAIVLAFLITFCSPLVAQNFAKGLAAAQAGDYATALKEWKPLAEAGGGEAQFNLGIMHDNGQGIIQDYKEAMRWFKLAALQKNVIAQFNLANHYFMGQGVAQDYKEAVKGYRLTAEQGYTMAQFMLGAMYTNGHGVLQDNTIAHMWYNLANANGNELGSTYRDEVAKKMTAEDISKAQAMARECMNSGYTKCGY